MTFKEANEKITLEHSIERAEAINAFHIVGASSPCWCCIHNKECRIWLDRDSVRNFYGERNVIRSCGFYEMDDSD